MPNVSGRRVCVVLSVPRSAVHERPETVRVPAVDAVLALRLQRLIAEHPTFGYRRLWALLRFHEGLRIHRQAVSRVLVLQGWFGHQRRMTRRPRVQGRRSRASRSNERWAMDVTHIDCGSDGWAHLAAGIDCHDRELVGYAFARRGRAQEAERALEAACVDRFGTLRPDGNTPMLRSDNGRIFQSRRFRAAGKDYRLRQEFITPYTPEQNGRIEVSFRSLKDECVWQHRLPSFGEARRAVRRWIDWYNERRPRQALRYLRPRQYRASQLQRVA